MSLSLSFVVDALVAVLLMASIASSLRLSRRMARLKADETAMRQTVAELLVATDSAERAIAGLRATVSECDRTLGQRLRAAEAAGSRLDQCVTAGEAVVTRVARIADATRRPPARPEASSPPASPARAENLKAAIVAARDVAERSARRLEGRAA